MESEDNPDGGSIFGISIPMEYVMLKDMEGTKGGTSDAKT